MSYRAIYISLFAVFVVFLVYSGFKAGRYTNLDDLSARVAITPRPPKAENDSNTRSEETEITSNSLRQGKQKIGHDDQSLSMLLIEIGSASEPWRSMSIQIEKSGASFIRDCLQVVDETTPKAAQAVLFQAAINEPKPEMLQVIADRYDSMPENSEMRIYFREMVQSFRDESMVEGLASLASTLTEAEFREDSLAWTAVGTLAQIGSAPAIDAILNLADNVEQELREALLLPLQMYQSPDALTLIIAVARSQGRTASPALRIACVRLLGSYQEPKAQQALHDLSSNPDPNIAEVARSSLR